MDQLDRKYSTLRRILRSYGSLLVAYSGGVDSTLLLRVAAEVLGNRVLGVTATSATYSDEELKYAKRAARELGVRHRVVVTDELADERFSSNPVDRCYWCKRGLIQKLEREAAREGIRHIAVAAQMDDLHDYRPGERAVREAGAVNPLKEARFTKSDVRLLSKRLGLTGWRREAMACLASRIPYGERVTREALQRVARAEAFLRRRGFTHVRVRCHGRIARIEVAPPQIGRLVKKKLRAEMAGTFKRLGFLYVCVDLEGYRMGSLNDGLKLKGVRMV